MKIPERVAKLRERNSTQIAKFAASSESENSKNIAIENERTSLKTVQEANIATEFNILILIEFFKLLLELIVCVF